MRPVRKTTPLFLQLTVVLGLVLAVAACSGTCDQTAENREVVMRTTEVLNARDYDRLSEFMSPTYRRHCQATPDHKVESLDDLKEMLRSWDVAFPEAVIKIDLIAAEGDLVAIYGTYSGIQYGPMGEFPATGKEMACDFAGFHRIEEGKIAETWVTWDNLAVLQQLGLFPPPSGKTVEEKPESSS